MRPALVIGVNKYSHSASCALVNSAGRVLFALSRERMTRKKYDGGDVAALVSFALEQTGLDLHDVTHVVETCHLFRIDEFEPRLPFLVSQRCHAEACLDPANAPHGRCTAVKYELSHHLAHAWSGIFCCPFDEGLVVVMDGMGSELADMRRGGRGYSSDFGLPSSPDFVQKPAYPDLSRGWREAETAYAFRGADLRLLFKRWTPLRSPSLLHNYGFENMESLGAVYSRVSSHIFGNWNACGKVMGLAGYGRPGRLGPTMTGPLEDLRVNWGFLDGLRDGNTWDENSLKLEDKDLAATVQDDLERIALDFLRRLKDRTGARNLVFTGGVALNSLLNGRIIHETGFSNVFVPPAPGDDGAAIGCAAFGLHTLARRPRHRRHATFSAFIGGQYDRREVRAALGQYPGRLTVSRPADLLGEAAERLARGQVVAWYQGRSEFGPRALGNRSILAHPGIAGMVDRLNVRVKGRERFRPFAPTVLAEEADAWFESVSDSPYMSFTASVRPEAKSRIPAVTHVDGTSRLQLLRRSDNPLYYHLIRRFRDLTGLPLVLNTSFNIEGEPIVETPDDAVWSFLRAEIDCLVMGPWLVGKRPFPQEDDLPSLIVRSSPDLMIETVYHASGALNSATLYLRGRGEECGELGLAILEQCAEPARAADVLRSVAGEGVFRPQDTVAELRRLYERCIVIFEPTDA